VPFASFCAYAVKLHTVIDHNIKRKYKVTFTDYGAQKEKTTNPFLPGCSQLHNFQNSNMKLYFMASNSVVTTYS
jgi:hypothetical protein